MDRYIVGFFLFILMLIGLAVYAGVTQSRAYDEALRIEAVACEDRGGVLLEHLYKVGSGKTEKTVTQHACVTKDFIR